MSGTPGTAHTMTKSINKINWVSGDLAVVAVLVQRYLVDTRRHRLALLRKGLTKKKE